MSIENLVQSLENKLIALDAKKKMAVEKGNLELLDMFGMEYVDTKVTLEFIKKSLGERTKSIAAIREEIDKVIKENLEYFQGEILKLREDSLKYFNESFLDLKIEIHNEKDIFASKLQKFNLEIEKLKKYLEAYTRGNRFIRAWKVLIGKL